MSAAIETVRLTKPLARPAPYDLSRLSRRGLIKRCPPAELTAALDTLDELTAHNIAQG